MVDEQTTDTSAKKGETNDNNSVSDSSSDEGLNKKTSQDYDKIISELKKTTEQLRGELEAQKATKNNFESERQALLSKIEEYTKKERESLESQAVERAKKLKIKDFKISDSMSNDFLQGFILGNPVVEKNSTPPPNIPSGEGEKPIDNKKKLINRLLS